MKIKLQNSQYFDCVHSWFQHGNVPENWSCFFDTGGWNVLVKYYYDLLLMKIYFLLKLILIWCWLSKIHEILKTKMERLFLFQIFFRTMPSLIDNFFFQGFKTLGFYTSVERPILRFFKSGHIRFPYGTVSKIWALKEEQVESCLKLAFANFSLNC
jgi:hypothetical protein